MTTEVSSLYKDFEKWNVVWCWQKNENDEYFFGEYDVNHSIAGDTDSIMMRLPASVNRCTVDEIVDIADLVGENANKSFPDFCKHAFNVPEQRKDTIKTDREIVSDKSLFLTKKRYIMHVVDKEGERVDDLKIMGVEMKKSDTSVAIKELLMKLVLKILDGASQKEVLAMVGQMKEDFYEMPFESIAKPISVKTMKRCLDIYEMTGDMHGFPYQVRAAMFWNKISTQTDKKVQPGEKIGLLYIRHPESKYIGFPIDTKLPEWFNDQIKVDLATEWEKAKKKIENYLTSLDWDIQGRKDTIKKELFGLKSKKELKREKRK